jgi:hypothetical protein
LNTATNDHTPGAGPGFGPIINTPIARPLWCFSNR